VRCYLNAIQLDPQFAPPYYALGEISLRHAEYEQADVYFEKFLKFATEEDRQGNDIYVYYSPDEVDRLMQRLHLSEADTLETDNSGERSGQKEEEKAAGAARELKTVIGFRSVGGHIGVTVLLNETSKAEMLLDTGAGVTLLSTKTARDLGLLKGRMGTIRLKTIAQDLQVPLTKLDLIRLGDLRKTDFPVAVSDLPFAGHAFDGILGMDFLKDFNIFINNQSDELILTRKGD
jgi:clan AA aspartic protease (TIGR02281 family)